MNKILDYLRTLLEFPFVWNSFEKIIGGSRAKRKFVKNFIIPFEGASILDIGCGTGEIINYMPEDINYVGFDLSNKYIDYAKNKHGNKGDFYCENITNNISSIQKNTFDFVIALGIIHHLNDNDALILIEKAKNYLKPGGVFMTMDPVYVKNQSKISKFLIDNDRGDYVGNAGRYRSLFEWTINQAKSCKRAYSGLFNQKSQNKTDIL